MEYEILQTGSSGNGTIINGHVLIDCGISFKKVQPYIRGLDLVLLTHIHGDHFRASTVKELHRQRPTLRFGCFAWMAGALRAAKIDERCIDIYDAGYDYIYRFSRTYTVRGFPLVHNVENCGYIITEAGESVLYATDTGSMEHITARDLDLYLIEANHSEAEIEARAAEKLEAGEYSYEAAAAVNHLSKEKALEWLSKNMGPRSKYVFMHQHVDREAIPLNAEPDN